ncbi:MAG: TonB family protein [Candidatus Poribacteria bacterium]|nr:TonB family protein [Candidatus Poribacteria bacterium]
MKSIKTLSTIICLLILTSSNLSSDLTVPPPTDLKPPRHKNIIEPKYPEAARKAKKEGKVTLTATIDVNGIPQNIVDLTNLGFGLEEAAIEAFKKATFHPATKAGKPISMKVKIDFDFKLEDPEPDMVFIPAGDFQMGSSSGLTDEKPTHTIYLDAFYIDKFEVTNAQYKKFVDANPQWQKDQIPRKYHDGYYLAHWNGKDFPPGKDNYPVVYVSWYAAMAYAQWAGKRLPTEAEWEKAARGGLIDKMYPWGDSVDATKANYYDGTDKERTPVGTFPPNGFGLYNMMGNVREWCLDEYAANFYINSPRENPIAGANDIDEVIKNFVNLKNNRVLRGGSWLSSPQSSRVANRNWRVPTDTNPNEGFRCVK